MAFHLRFTPDEVVPDENIPKFLEKLDRYIVAYERTDKKGEATKPHYHMYIECDIDVDKLRYWFKTTMRIPTGGQGQHNKYYSIAKWRNVGDFSYVVKQGCIVHKKGFSDEDVLQAIEKQEELKRNKNSETADRAATRPLQPKEKEDEWTKILNHCMELKDDRPTTQLGFKQVICRYYLKRLRPVPRIGDLNRYAFSLYAIFRSKYCELDDKLNVDVLEYLDDISPKQA